MNVDSGELLGYGLAFVSLVVAVALAVWVVKRLMGRGRKDPLHDKSLIPEDEHVDQRRENG